MEVLPVDDNFVQFFGLQIVEGRDFRESDNQNEAGSIIPNETFMKMFPQFHVGSLMYGHVDNCEIVGVVKDFNFKSLQHAMGPIVLYNWGKEGWRSFGTMYVRTVPGADFKDVSDSIKDAICKFDPRREPDMITVSHLDKWIEDMYQSEQSLGKLITIASFVALLIAIIGIIGLVFFETQFIRKEIAVRRESEWRHRGQYPDDDQQEILDNGLYQLCDCSADSLLADDRLAQGLCLPGARAGVDLPCGTDCGRCHYLGRRHTPKLESRQCQPCRIVKE